MLNVNFERECGSKAKLISSPRDSVCVWCRRGGGGWGGKVLDGWREHQPSYHQPVSYKYHGLAPFALGAAWFPVWLSFNVLLPGRGGKVVRCQTDTTQGFRKPEKTQTTTSKGTSLENFHCTGRALPGTTSTSDPDPRSQCRI